MTDIIIRDSLRQAVELQSGGAQTVIYTPKGQPNFLNVIPKATIGEFFPTVFPNDITVHPAFKVGGKTLRQIFIGTYNGAVKDGELVSQPGIPVRNSIEFLSGMAALKAVSTPDNRFHAMTLTEKALLIAIASKANFNPWGLGEFGVAGPIAGTVPTQYKYEGIRVDGTPIIDHIPPTTRSDVYGGTGPLAVRLDGKYNGISDPHFQHGDITGSGGVHSHALTGFRVFAGEVQVLVDNDAAAVTDLDVWTVANRNAAWKAIDGPTGDFVTPTYTGTEGVDLKATTPNTVRVLPNGSAPGAEGYRPDMPAYSYCTENTYTPFQNIRYNLTGNALKRMQVLGLIPTGNESNMIRGSGNGITTTLAFMGTSTSPSAVYNFVNARFVNYGSLWSLAAQYAGEKAGNQYVFRPFMYRVSDLT